MIDATATATAAGCRRGSGTASVLRSLGARALVGPGASAARPVIHDKHSAHTFSRRTSFAGDEVSLFNHRNQTSRSQRWCTTLRIGSRSSLDPLPTTITHSA